MSQHHIWISAGILAVIGGMGVTRLQRLEHALRKSEERSAGMPAGLRALALELADARDEWQALEAELQRVSAADSVATTAADRRLTELAQALGSLSAELACRIEEQALALQGLEQWSQNIGGEFEQTRAMEARVVADQHWEDLRTEVAEARALAQGISADLQVVHHTLARDEETMWRELVGPAVQLAGASTVGSGILLRRSNAAEARDARPVVLTAWHVVRDIFAESAETEPPIPIVLQSSDGTLRREQALLRAHDVGLDVALLELDATPGTLPQGAVLASRDELRQVRIFQEIYAVGCPLGNDPIPTRGEISHTHHLVDGKSYWMISAPTYIGNSGGGIFAARTHALLGVFSKIYTHGNLRPTIVPHMGLVTPLERILDWVEAGTVASLVPCDQDATLWTIELRSPAQD